MGGRAAKHGRPSKVRQLSPRTVEEMKAKIRVDRIIDRLMDHIDSDAVDENGVCHGTMASSAVTAALGLLRKILPDISESKVEHTNKNIRELSDAELLAIASSERVDQAPADPSKLN